MKDELGLIHGLLATLTLLLNILLSEVK